MAAVRTELEWSVARGIAGFRWLALSWAAIVLVLTRDDVDGPGVGAALLGAGLAVTAATTEASIRRRPWLFHPGAVAAEVAVGASMLLLDGQVYAEAHSQSVGSAWPVAGVLMAALVTGPLAGAAAGVVLGAARWLGDLVANFQASNLGLLSSAVLFTIAGGAAGAAVERLRHAETAIARARAREEVARTLHDGVLQTLAVVQRRSSDAELAALAREQELELRAFLAGDRPQAASLGAALRAIGAKVERRDGLRVEVLLVDEDHGHVAPAVVDAVAGAVGEALTNAHKHGAATRATVFVDVDDDVFCSVKDDGRGFDPAVTPSGSGLTGSIVGRLAEVGGTAEVDARPGAGVEVRLRAPRRPAAPGGEPGATARPSP
jgi:signal transduction histidine kinase